MNSMEANCLSMEEYHHLVPPPPLAIEQHHHQHHHGHDQPQPETSDDVPNMGPVVLANMVQKPSDDVVNLNNAEQIPDSIEMETKVAIDLKEFEEPGPKTSIPTLIIVKDGVCVDEVINSLKNKTYAFTVPGLPSNILEIIYSEDEEVSRCRNCNKRNTNSSKRSANNRRRRKSRPVKRRANQEEFSPLDVVETIYDTPDPGDDDEMDDTRDDDENDSSAVNYSKEDEHPSGSKAESSRKRRKVTEKDKAANDSDKSDNDTNSNSGDVRKRRSLRSRSSMKRSVDPEDGKPEKMPMSQECPVCKKVYSSKYLSRHMRFHGTDRPYKCDECTKSFKDVGGLKYHKATHTRPEPIACELCDKKFTTETTLDLHINRMHKEESQQFECNECDKKYYTKYGLERHKQNHKGGFKCEYCAATYLDIKSFKKHVRNHTGQFNERDLKYKCDVCEHIADTEKLLRDHKMLHSGEKPHLCDTCGARFRLKKALTQHQYCHSDIKRFKCNECGEGFKSRSAYQDHEDRHKGIKRHVCQFCGQQFYASSNMFKHIKSNHSNEKNFDCSACDKRFSSKQELQQHTRTHRQHHIPPMPHPRQPMIQDMRPDPARMLDFNPAGYPHPAHPQATPGPAPGPSWFEYWNPS